MGAVGRGVLSAVRKKAGLAGGGAAVDLALVAAANLSFGVSQWVMFWIVARTNAMSVAGDFALALALVVPVFMVSNLGLRPYLSSVPLSGGVNEGTVLGVRLVTTAAALAVLVGVSVLGDVSGLMVAGLGVGKAGEAVGDICMGILHRRSLFRRNSVNVVGRGVAGIAGFMGGLYLGGSVGACWGYGLLTCLAVAMVEVRSVVSLPGCNAGDSAVRWAGAWAVLTRSAPLGVVGILLSVVPLVPRWVLKDEMGIEAVAEYTAMYQVVQVGLVASVSVGQYLAPLFRVAFSTGGGRVGVMAFAGGGFFIIGSVLAAGVAAVSGLDVMGWLYGAAYSGDGGLLGLMLMAGGVACAGNVLGFAVTAGGERVTQVWLQALVLVVCVGFNVALVASMGVAGAVWSYCVVSAVSFGGLAVLFERLRRKVEVGGEVVAAHGHVGVRRRPE